MMHPEIKKLYFHGIKELIKRPFDVLPSFCDWLDENDIRSQRFREVLALLDKVEEYKSYNPEEKTSSVIYCLQLYTKHKCITIVYCPFDNRITIQTKRKEYVYKFEAVKYLATKKVERE